MNPFIMLGTYAWQPSVSFGEQRVRTRLAPLERILFSRLFTNTSPYIFRKIIEINDNYILYVSINVKTI